MGEKYLLYDKKWDIKWRKHFIFYKATSFSTKTHNVKISVWAKDCHFIMDNARIHRTDKIIKMLKDNKLVVFTIPPYSPELNKIENTFGRLKNRISFQNLNSKDFKHVIIEEIRKL